MNERDRGIVEAILQGEAVPDISQRIGCSERTVERVQKRLHEQLLQLIE